MKIITILSLFEYFFGHCYFSAAL